MSDSKHKKGQILVIGIGNIGREDDGLGWEMADRISELELEHVTVEYRYQLQVEDAQLVSEFPMVVFVDASHEPIADGFCLKSCKPASHYFYSSHQQSPETVLYLAENLYQKTPESYTLAIQGVQWDLGEKLSEPAKHHFRKALSFFITFLKNKKENSQPFQEQSFAQVQANQIPKLSHINP